MIESLKRFGDRTSSFLTSYPSFQSYSQIRYLESGRSWIAATEPLAPKQDRKRLVDEFVAEAVARGKRAVISPVSRGLAEELRLSGYNAIQFGAEPVFDLKEYFTRGIDPLLEFSHARALSRKGVEIVELDTDELAPGHEAAIRELTEEWIEAKASGPLGFLNQVDPLHLKTYRKIFAAFYQGRMVAFVSAVPIFATRSFYFAEYVRSPQGKAGLMELLLIESMRLLWKEGWNEVRLGTCPFARLELAGALSLKERLIMKVMSLAYKHGRFPMSFQSIHDFKAKFDPTRWEQVFLVTRPQDGMGVFVDLLRAHLPGGLIRTWLSTQVKQAAKLIRPDVQIRTLPKNAKNLLARSAVTVSLVTLFFGLHILRLQNPEVQRWFDLSAYNPGEVTWRGVFAGPAFHNNWYHLSGDLLSFLIFGAALETLKGRTVFMTALALGLWASNPVSHAAVAAILPQLDPIGWPVFLNESDYGSSNAIYAFVGALAALISRPKWLILPFLLNGIFLCLSRGSWLSLHHLAGLGLGYLCGVVTRKEKGPSVS